MCGRSAAVSDTPVLDTSRLTRAGVSGAAPFLRPHFILFIYPQKIPVGSLSTSANRSSISREGWNGS